ncbi:23S rRNA (guanosine(2251)-2'-O)-methyltransferase RlmB [Hymenobacter convexus]|uniref:23S rRNA (guanosine(2251)-2'-O)-methyltransferase RlmB n=1 Tax=Hymenobacter sp. CA1UV-4 TaxID=3063782 RepID=UPI002713798F|nr:23S rRNA (guanosine(2251)-2'-O)-methyltransferase RlmB [Hymenobacter sp. CA1UV-4]MDO7851246.1 23S rRNA (guanosine(2251)-2'-O)-methyltransferase RlmB [Hymenobacter sp. CA1UV-4]
MENPTDRPDRPERPQRPARPLAGRRFYDGANRPVTPKQFRPDRGGSEFDDRPARPRGRGGSDNRDDAPEGRGDSRPPYRERGEGAGRSGGSDRPRYENRPAQASSIDMLFGLRPILEALSAGRTLEKIFLLRGTKNSLVTDISTAAREAGIQVQLVPVEKLDNLTRKNHQGAVAFVSPIDYAPLDNIVSGLFEEGKVPFLLLLDRITDVRNFGAIARTAECLGVQAIVVPSRGAAQINGDALKTSAGALNILPVCREVSLHETIRFLQQSGITVVACTEKAEDAVGSAEIDFTGPVAVLMGSEEDGISPDLLNLADVKLKVPMTGQIQSLNVGVAAGIMLFEVARQRVQQA